MSKLANEITITREGRNARIFIDGKEFPWYISESGVSVQVAGDEIPSVTLTIVADRIHVADRGFDA